MTSAIVDPRLNDALGRAKRPLITSHIRLDGDAIGSELGLYHILAELGGEPQVVNDGPIPEVYRFLPGADRVGTSVDELREGYDLVVAVDAPEWSRLGALAERLSRSARVVNIDHHPGNTEFGDLNWVDTGRSSVGEMIYLLASNGGWHIGPEAATCLHVAIMTDTGRFTFPNTSSEAMRAAAHLLDLGADLRTETREIYQSETLNMLRLRAMATHTIRLEFGGAVAVMRITRKMFEETQIDPINTQEFSEMARAVKGVRVGILLREMPMERVKVSLRSADEFDVQQVAAHFGGGGHRQAAGFEMEGSLDHVEAMVLAEIGRQLDREPRAHKTLGL